MGLRLFLPLMETPFYTAPDIVVLPSFLARPVSGGMVVNAFLLKSEQPMLVDCGLFQDRTQFLAELEQQIDPQDLKWIWVTHADPDHIGSLRPVLEAAPSARVVTTSVGFGVLGLIEPVPIERAYFLNPGENLDVGDRTLEALKPPAYDDPATLGFYDSRSGALFSSDCFGAVLQAPAQDAADVEPAELREGQVAWAKSDFPWLHHFRHDRLHAELERIRGWEPKHILSTHLPPAQGMTEQFLDTLASIPSSPPAHGMSQTELEELIAELHSRGP